MADMDYRDPAPAAYSPREDGLSGGGKEAPHAESTRHSSRSASPARRRASTPGRQAPRRPKSGRGWRRFVLIYTLVFLLLGAAGLFVFYQYLDAYEQSRPSHVMDALMAEYRALSATLGSEVRVIGTDGEFTGRALDMDETGALIVALPDGERRTVMAGDVSVRGLMGYAG